MLTRDQVLHVAALTTALADRLPVEVVCILPRHGATWGAPVVVGIGWPDEVTARPREVLRSVLTAGGDTFVLVHTHTTGKPPGADDAAVTRRLVSAAAVLGLTMVGHVVLGPSAVWECLSGLEMARRPRRVAN